MLVVAVDGATWRVMDPMLERGELPALAALRARGCHGTMPRHPVATIDSEPRRSARGQPTSEPEEAEQRQIEELRALGYFE